MQNVIQIHQNTKKSTIKTKTDQLLQTYRMKWKAASCGEYKDQLSRRCSSEVAS